MNWALHGCSTSIKQERQTVWSSVVESDSKGRGNDNPSPSLQDNCRMIVVHSCIGKASVKLIIAKWRDSNHTEEIQFEFVSNEIFVQRHFTRHWGVFIFHNRKWLQVRGYES
jgi:hypothetical protein